MLDNMNYNRSKRMYEVETAEGTETFPAGPNGRREAFKAAVYTESPRLFRFIADFVKERPYLESRAWKAAELVLASAVKATQAPNALAEVEGNSEYGAYLVREVMGVLVCDCPDYLELGAPYDETGQPWCKHLIAFVADKHLATRTCYHCQTAVEVDAMTCPHCGQEVEPF